MFSVTTGMVVFRKTTAPKNLLGGVEMGARNLISAVLLVSSFIVSGSASAHNNPTAMYEPESVVLTGTVTRYEWANPHSIISVAVKTDKGTVEQWHAGILPPADMIRDGWTKETIKPGDQVTMTGRPGRHAQRIMWLESLVTAEGQKIGRKP